MTDALCSIEHEASRKQGKLTYANGVFLIACAPGEVDRRKNVLANVL